MQIFFFCQTSRQEIYIYAWDSFFIFLFYVNGFLGLLKIASISNLDVSF